MPTIWALCHLTQSSPTYHELYISERERIFTRVVINELHSKGIDNFKANTVLEVRLEPGLELMMYTRYRSIYAALEEIHDQLSIPRAPLVLSLDHCRALLKVDNAVEWVVSMSPSDGGIVARYKSVPRDKSEYWTQNRKCYHPVVVKASPAMANGFDAVVEVMKAEQIRQTELREISNELVEQGIEDGIFHEVDRDTLVEEVWVVLNEITR